MAEADAPAGSPEAGEHADSASSSPLQELRKQLDALLASLEDQVLESHQQTFDHLLLYEGAVQELQSAVSEAAAANSKLTEACDRLAEATSTTPHMHTHLLAISEMVKKLETGVWKLEGEGVRPAEGIA